MSPAWQDVSMYGRYGDRTQPNAYEITIGKFRVRIEHRASYPPDVWVASYLGDFCGQIDQHTALKRRDLSGAQQEALMLLDKDMLDARKLILEVECEASV